MRLDTQRGRQDRVRRRDARDDGAPGTGAVPWYLRYVRGAAPVRLRDPQAERAGEPAVDLRRPGWKNAQAGFRVHRDWLAIVNRYPTTRSLPAYITSTNTWTSDTRVPPAQNYPKGWLSTALTEVNSEPQIKALCWFVDTPLGETWSEFSLSRHPGRLHDAAEEFDGLLQK